MLSICFMYFIRRKQFLTILFLLILQFPTYSELSTTIQLYSDSSEHPGLPVNHDQCPYQGRQGGIPSWQVTPAASSPFAPWFEFITASTQLSLFYDLAGQPYQQILSLQQSDDLSYPYLINLPALVRTQLTTLKLCFADSLSDTDFNVLSNDECRINQTNTLWLICQLVDEDSRPLQINSKIPLSRSQTLATKDSMSDDLPETGNLPADDPDQYPLQPFLVIQSKQETPLTEQGIIIEKALPRVLADIKTPAITGWSDELTGWIAGNMKQLYNSEQLQKPVYRQSVMVYMMRHPGSTYSPTYSPANVPAPASGNPSSQVSPNIPQTMHATGQQRTDSPFPLSLPSTSLPSTSLSSMPPALPPLEPLPLEPLPLEIGDQNPTGQRTPPKKDGKIRFKPYQSRKRTIYTPSQLKKLSASFRKRHYLSSDERETLAADVNLTETQIKTWFQNRRAKYKRNKEEGHDDELSNPPSPPPSYVYSYSPSYGQRGVPTMVATPIAGLGAMQPGGAQRFSPAYPGGYGFSTRLPSPLPILPQYSWLIQSPIPPLVTTPARTGMNPPSYAPVPEDKDHEDEDSQPPFKPAT